MVYFFGFCLFRSSYRLRCWTILVISLICCSTTTEDDCCSMIIQCRMTRLFGWHRNWLIAADPTFDLHVSIEYFSCQMMNCVAKIDFAIHTSLLCQVDQQALHCSASLSSLIIQVKVSLEMQYKVCKLQNYFFTKSDLFSQ